VRSGETVAVIGCGGIGLNAIQGAAIAGAGRIIAVDRLASKLAMAQGFGATDTVDASVEEPVEAVLALTSGEGVDHAIEAIGLKATAQQAFAMIGRGGTATVIGMVPVGQPLEIDATQLLGGKRLQGSNMGSNRFRIDIPRYVDWYLAGRLELDALVSATMPLERINDGFATLAGGEVARQLILFA
jgi:S-(hydroxymethyl)glutathione dehydrogenase/alcohol dehydrogenase